ncbi:hypothetical protein RR46_01122 [Papilio xuthus]|uniref:Metallothionein n=1 Tax=Papilio xuthus TaxID=66420 RepID=A0A0N1IE36_PAPXU|nr:hypothetical protein RR46_01122 [Papilio xuthus]
MPAPCDSCKGTCGGGTAACGAGCTCGPSCTCGDGKPSGGKPCCQGDGKNNDFINLREYTLIKLL